MAMAGPTRRTVLLGGVAGVAAAGMTGLPAGAAPAPLSWVGAGPFEHVYDPTPAGPPYQYMNDHCLIRGKDGSWHLFGIIGDCAPVGSFPDGAKEIHINHATAPRLKGPWRTQPHVLTVDPAYFKEEHLWAPHVIEHDGTYYMYYAAGGAGCAINLATSRDLFSWRRIPTGPVFRGLVARDPYVTRIDGAWVMYYCEIAGWGSHHTVAARTSSDLLTWSEPRTVFTDASTDSNASVTESPYVVQRDGWWYLFIGPRSGYVGTDVYRSKDPFSFRVEDYAGHLPSHAAEILEVDGNWWATHTGSFQHGVYLAPLTWRSTPPIWHTSENPAAVLNHSGRLELFALDQSSRIQRSVQNVDGGWGPWSQFSDPVAAVPTIGKNRDGRLELFAVGSNATVLHRVQRANGTWGSWEQFGRTPAGAAPTISRQADGRLHAFLLGPGGSSISQCHQTSPGSMSWTAWEPFGGPAGAPPVVGIHADGRQEVFALGPGNSYIAHRWQTTPNGAWSPWNNTFGGPAGALGNVSRDGSGLLSVLAMAPYGAGVYRRTQSAPNAGWAEWQNIDSWADAASRTAVNADGRLELFTIPPGGAQITHKWQVNNTNGEWSGAEVFDARDAVTTPTVVVDATGRQHVFALSPDGTLRERVQAFPSSGWSPWVTLGGRLLVVPAGQPT
ncbi:family 43 glycosylhydrolase [Kribbella catacumbae]|uniref:family 43 glycosylhydrolase n=1 Tax=Kribbella catacumbae TaxID=460086 RepID=UPI000379CC8E|nr:family 43 glycosylhydrolase [Kribbella catacumbae]